MLCSTDGIRLVELRDSRMVCFHHWEFLGRDPPTIVHIPWAQVDHWPSDDRIEVVAVGENGAILKGTIPRPL